MFKKKKSSNRQYVNEWAWVYFGKTCRHYFVCFCMLALFPSERVHGPSPNSQEFHNLQKLKTHWFQPLYGVGSQDLEEFLREPPGQVVTELVLEPRSSVSEAPAFSITMLFSNSQNISLHQLILTCQTSRDCPFCQMAHGSVEDHKSSSQRLLPFLSPSRLGLLVGHFD